MVRGISDIVPECHSILWPKKRALVIAVVPEPHRFRGRVLGVGPWYLILLKKAMWSKTNSGKHPPKDSHRPIKVAYNSFVGEIFRRDFHAVGSFCKSGGFFSGIGILDSDV